jgi:hypothetical protein
MIRQQRWESCTWKSAEFGVMADSDIRFLHVVCYKWGTVYPADEVNILKAMVDRNLTVPHAFHCITDDPSGLSSDIVVHGLPELPGFYKKIYAYSDDFLGLKGQTIAVLDIDLVILGNIDFLAQEPGRKFMVARDARDDARTHTAVFRLEVGSHSEVWEAYVKDPEGAELILPHRQDRDQVWAEAFVRDIGYFPREKIVSFKYDCRSESARIFGKVGAKFGLTTAHFGNAEPPSGAAIVSFHGQPLPRDVRDSRFLHYRRAPFVQQCWRA